MDSVRLVHPEWEQFVLLADELQGEFDPAAEPFEIVPVQELAIPNKQQFFYRYTILELNTAVKPWFLEWLFEKRGVERVVYLDPDIYVYQPMREVVSLLDGGAFMVLTPHLTGELDDGRNPTEHDILKAGCYNLGFIALGRHPQLSAFLHWWQRKLEFHCRVAISENLFVDQRWMDLAPGLFADVSILRHEGYNVAYWNLNHRMISQDSGKWLVRGGERPLVFFHFSGLNPHSPREFSRHQDRFRLGSFCREELKATRQLVQDYCKATLSNGLDTCKNWRYAFATLKDGTPIADCMRHYYRSFPEVQQHVGADPFQHDHAYLNQPWDNQGGPLVTSLMRFIWESQVPLQRSFPDISGAWRYDFVDCFVSRVSSWESLPERYVAPARASLAQASRSGHVPAPWRGEADLFQPTPGESLSSRLARRALRSVVRFMVVYTPLPKKKATLRALYHSFRPLGRWLPAHFRAQLKAEVHYWMHHRKPAPLKNLKRSARCVGPWLKRLAAKLLGMRTAEDGTRDRQSGVRSQASGEKQTQAPKLKTQCFSKWGMNIIGYIRSEHGVGESARLCAQAATEVGLPIAACDFNIGNQSRTADDSLRPFLREAPRYWINLFHVNADQMPVVYRHLGRKFFEGRYNIGFWHWELPEFPNEWLASFNLVDEVWVPSRFVQESIQAKSPRPVIRIPHGIRFRVDPEVRRADLGLPENGFLFLTMFDMRSIQERKNPQAVIEAFRRAFPVPGDAYLVMKINNAESFPKEVGELKARLGEPGRVVLIDRIFSRQNVYNLESLCDCFVSLHRAEGFGLGPAESMYLGKPVIATNWSGNVDFMNADNSCPVDYELVRLNRDYGPYRAGQLWAEPDIDHAAWYMTRLLQDPAWARDIAARGRETIRTLFSPQVVGSLYLQRIAAIYSERGHLSGGQSRAA